MLKAFGILLLYAIVYMIGVCGFLMAIRGIFGLKYSNVKKHTSKKASKKQH